MINPAAFEPNFVSGLLAADLAGNIESANLFFRLTGSQQGDQRQEEQELFHLPRMAGFQYGGHVGF